MTLIPEDPFYVPDQSKRADACNQLAEIASEFDSIKVILSDKVSFFYCGGSFGRIYCSGCAGEIPLQWWNLQSGKDVEGGGFKLAAYSTPCCGYRATLNDLIYERPQGFSLFGLEIMNSDLGELDKQYKNEFEQILDTPLRVIYQHI